jgi:hypothetical protein
LCDGAIHKPMIAVFHLMKLFSHQCLVNRVFRRRTYHVFQW